MSTLVEELEQAADRAEERHRKASKEAAAKGIAMLCDDALEATRLRKRVERIKEVTDLGDTCAHCDLPPACIGVYEDSTAQSALACDQCCGHGNEDGWCKLLTEYLTGDL